MDQPTTYSLLAADAYWDARSATFNQAPIPPGWKVLDEFTVSGSGANASFGGSGFSARVFQGPAGEIVISYAGTEFGGSTNGLINDFTSGNIPLAAGSYGMQAAQAALLYERVQEKFGANSNISFTGHSLGGGLASLMAVWFDRPATVFDPAPFENAARGVVIPPFFFPAAAPVALALTLKGFLDPKFFGYSPLFQFSQREANVKSFAVEGEILEKTTNLFFPVIETGRVEKLMGAAPGLEMGDKHSIDLLSAVLMNSQFESAATALGDVLPILFNRNFYGPSALGNLPNLLVKLVRGEVGVAGTDGVQIQAPNALLTRFTNDLGSLVNTSSVDPKALTAMIAQQIEWYAFTPETPSAKQFFSTADGALQYTIAIGAYQGANNKAISYVEPWLKDVASQHGVTYSSSFAVAEQWNVAITTGGATAAAIDSNKAQLFVGGAGNDKFTGGNLDDVLFGGIGADTLVGGTGSDELFGGIANDSLDGGAGYDEYRIDGHDTITDSDSAGFIEDKSGNRIAGVVEKHADGTYSFLGDSSITVAMSGSDLTLTLASGDSATIKNFQDGELGLHLSTPDHPAQINQTILGDLAPKDFDASTPGIQAQTDALGNVITDPNTPQADRSDFLYDSSGNDDIQGKGGFDYIDAFRGGDDKLDGGSGDDIVIGRDGNDTVIGGAGSDILRGDKGTDHVFAGAQAVDVDAALANQDAAPSGLRGDAMDGGVGDDTIIGDTGSDAIFGGTGSDLIVAGAGDDNIDGDTETDSVALDWSVTRSVNTQSNGFVIYFTNWNQIGFHNPTSGGDDVIYAGGGDDWVRGEWGNDYIDGGAGKDVLYGQEGHDELFGDAGDDVLTGDGPGVALADMGNDYLDGEDGNDWEIGDGGDDRVFGGAGNDTLQGDSDPSAWGNDYLDGEDGNDSMFGGGKDDTMFGGAGNDTLQGDSGLKTGDGNDSLDGEAGNDLMFGEGGADTLTGGDGADQIAGDYGGSDAAGGNDVIFGGAGNDTIDGQGGDDNIDAGADDDLVAGGNGNDTIAGGDGADQLQGQAGNDVINGDSGSDTLFGQDGNDTINGGADSDLIIGGKGDDALNGGDGDDFYYWNTGDGNDSISDSGGNDWIVFNDITLGQVGLGVGSLKLMLPGGAAIDIQDFDPDNPYAPGGIENFYFALTGQVFSKQQLIQALGGFKPTGTPDSDTLSGTALNDTVHGLDSGDVLSAHAGDDQVYGDAGDDELHGDDGNDLASGGDGNDIVFGDNGNDTLQGDAGNDTLIGGAGNDMLLGGDGDDVYLFIRGDGQDTAVDSSGTNRVALGGDLTLDAVFFGRAGNDLTVTVKGASDKLTVKDWFTAGSTFTSVIMGDGTALDHAGVDANMPSNLPPATQPDLASVTEDSVLSASGNALANDSDPEGHALHITNAGTFAGSFGTFGLQSDGSYTYTLANSSSAVQSLGANQTVTDTLAYTVTDDDPAGAANSQGTIVVTVHGTNDAPSLMGDASSVVEGGGALTGNVLANDHDVDAGTLLFVTSTGVGTGGWGTLTLNAEGSWTYALANGTSAVESLAVGQTVTDTFTFNVGDGITQVSESLVITVTGQDDAPVLSTALLDQATAANTRWTWQVPSSTFSDVDYGDALTYKATLASGAALPSWLSFDAATHTFDGRVPKGTTVSLDITVAVTDKSGLSTSDVFNLSFAGGKGGGGGGGGGKGGGSGGGSGGNEGVGNGEDPPPPGHTYNFNDGPGTSPGSPGAQGGNGYVPTPPQHETVATEVHVGAAIGSAELIGLGSTWLEGGYLG